ncbi:DUF1127 domain-containing protein [Nitrincola alkalisediminis]|uniref:DUF1127 domain-containing protein n=1 Tax=Nitrincola alkalisediminis TaxID=1366656 RepID=UPI00187526E8|nr:DUF1127 domain-containing protein [Nitrincola alkalisediminis]
MKACTSDEMSIIKSSHLDTHNSCKSTLENLNEKPWKAIFKKIIRNSRTRRKLRQLDKTQLEDIGLTASDVEQEVNKPLWK